MPFDGNAFNNFILSHNVVGFFENPITMNSGRQSHWYVNWRKVAEDVYLLDKLTDHVLAFVVARGLKAECFYGVPEGATKLGILLQFKWARQQADYAPHRYPLPMGRGKPKDHGDPADQLYLGRPRGHTVVVEDVTTTGGSLLAAVDALLSQKIPVIAAIALTNRNERRDDGTTVAEALHARGVPYYAMSNALDLLPHLKQQQRVSDELWRQIVAYFEQYGTAPLR